MGFNAEVLSEIAPLNHLVAAMIQSGKSSDPQNAIHVLRDPTRGGVATALNEIARQSKVAIVINEKTIPVRPAVAAACEMLGLDALYIANEGKLLAIVDPEAVDQVLMAMRNTHYGEETVIIGRVQESPQGRVLMKTAIGSTRVVDVLAGERVATIC